MDGTICFWDIKSPTSPKKVICPDGSAVLHMALSPFADLLAVATSKGLYALDVFEPEEVPRPLLLEGGKAPERPFADLAWNSSTQELYAAGHNGIIHVFSRLC
jgi:WD40 repeat protein